MSREMLGIRQVTNVEPLIESEAGGRLLDTIGKIGSEIARKNQEAKINENLSNAQLEINAITNQYRLNNEGDPLNEQTLKKYQGERQRVLDKYGQQISPLYRGAWNNGARQLGQKFDLDNQQWAYKQAEVNTKQSIATSMKNYLSQAEQDGKSFALSNDAALGSFLNLESSATYLKEFGNRNIGETSTNKILQDYKQDYVKMYISGVASENPSKALGLLDNPSVKNSISDAGDFESFKTHIENRAINRQEILARKEVLNKMSSSAELFNQNKPLTVAEIETAGAGMSEAAKDYFYKINGYKQLDKVDKQESFNLIGDLYAKIGELANQEEVKPQMAADIQDSVFSLMARNVISKEEGKKLLNNFFSVYNEQVQNKESDYSGGDWNPFNNDPGLESLNSYFENNLAIDEGEDGNKEVAFRNNANKAALYRTFFDEVDTYVPMFVNDRNPNKQYKSLSEIYDDSYAKNQFLRKVTDFTISRYRLDKVFTRQRNGSPALSGIPSGWIRQLIDDPIGQRAEFEKRFGAAAADIILETK